MDITIRRLVGFGRSSSSERGVTADPTGYHPAVKFRRHRGAAYPPLDPQLDPQLVDLAAGPDHDRALAELGLLDEGSLTTPFEDWCEATGTHPEAFGAWELFTEQSRPAS